MRSFKIDDDDLKQACINLRDANTALSEANKKASNAKKIIEQKLLKERGLNVRAEPIGEIISIDKMLLIEIGKQNRLDEEQLELDHAELYQSYKRDFPTVKFKPLIQ